jgi:hypothetical protein
MTETGPEFIPVILALLMCVDVVILYILAKKYYNWPMGFFVIFFTGLFFRREHWPLAGFMMSISLMFLSITSLINSVRFQFTMSKNPFLRWFGSISCFIIAIYVVGWLFMVQHWPRNIGDIFGYTGIFLYIISVLGMVFTLPGSNYLAWSKIEKKVFFRAVLLPMIIVFAFILIGNVFSSAYFWILGQGSAPWDISSGIRLLDLEGIPHL